ncbi:MAG: DMT family transporter [bacterium]|nr:DMT family transporter [bacterium]
MRKRSYIIPVITELDALTTLHKNPSNALFTLLMLLAMTAWGGSWVSAKLIAHLESPEVLIFWRFLFTFVSFLPVMLILKKSFRLSRSGLLKVVLGALLIVGYNKFFFLGLQFGLAGAGGVLVTTLNPVLTFLFALLLFKKAISRNQILGLILGFIGGAILLEIWKFSAEHLLHSGNAYFLIASVSWALLTLTSEKSRNDLSPIVFSFYVYGVSALLDLFLAMPHGGVFKVFQHDALFWLNIVYLSIFATTFATTVYFIASGRLGSQKASSFIFLVPVSAVLLSWGMLHETPKIPTIIGGLIAISAVYLINFGKKAVQPNNVT